MIGGYDWIVPPAELDWMLGVIQLAWPEGFFEEDGQNVLMPLRQMPLRQGDFFLYRDAESYRSWSDEGETPENRAAFIYLIVRDGEVTLVTGAPSGKVGVMNYTQLKEEVLNRIVIHQHQHQRRPTILHLTKEAEEILFRAPVQELGSALYAQLQVGGPRETFPSFLGLHVRWDQPRLEVLDPKQPLSVQDTLS